MYTSQISIEVVVGVLLPLAICWTSFSEHVLLCKSNATRPRETEVKKDSTIVDVAVEKETIEKYVEMMCIRAISTLIRCL